MSYQVILERRGQEPILLYSTNSHAKAQELAAEIVFREGPASGSKASVRRADSADQLQVTSQGRALRDQPHLVASGEALTIHVPTAKVRLEA